MRGYFIFYFIVYVLSRLLLHMVLEKEKYKAFKGRHNGIVIVLTVFFNLPLVLLAIDYFFPFM